MESSCAPGLSGALQLVPGAAGVFHRISTAFKGVPEVFQGHSRSILCIFMKYHGSFRDFQGASWPFREVFNEFQVFLSDLSGDSGAIQDFLRGFKCVTTRDFSGVPENLSNVSGASGQVH